MSKKSWSASGHTKNSVKIYSAKVMLRFYAKVLPGARIQFLDDILCSIFVVEQSHLHVF